MTLVKLNLPDHFVNALKEVYKQKTAKAAVESYIRSPIAFDHHDFLELCELLDICSSPTPSDTVIWARDAYNQVVAKAIADLHLFKVEGR